MKHRLLLYPSLVFQSALFEIPRFLCRTPLDATFTTLPLHYCISMNSKQDPIPCKYWLAYFFLRFALLFPTCYLAYLWRSGWWPASFLIEPEWVGVYIATYIALISTLGFSASINEVRKKETENNEVKNYA